MSYESKNYENRVELNGTIATIDRQTHGVNSKGMTYLSFGGTILCSDEPRAEAIKFNIYANALTSKGEPSENYEKLCKWLENVVTKVKDPENATKVLIRGNLSDGSYYNTSLDKTIEKVEYSGWFINDYDAAAGPYAKVMIGGYVSNFAEEVRDDMPTGRYRINILNTDNSGKPFEFKGIVPKEAASHVVESGVERGSCVRQFVFSNVLVTRESKKESEGWGDQGAGSSVYHCNEWHAIGGSSVYDEEKSFSSEEAKNLIEFRKDYLEQKKIDAQNKDKDKAKNQGSKELDF